MLHSFLADSFWLPVSASANAPESDNLFWFILLINIIFSSLIMALLVLFVIRYRHRKNQKHDPTGGHSTALELTWTIIPTLLVMVIFWFGFRGYLHANTMPPNAYEITANGQMWAWSFTYPTGYTDQELHLVVNKPTKMILQSADVIHDLDVPAFRMKKDAVPGRFNRMWFEPTLKGTYDVYCAMYCGTNHSTMLAKCVVQDQAEFDAWMKTQMVWEPRMSFIQRGQQLYKSMGCAGCHTVDGAVSTGPSWKDLYGSSVNIEGGPTVAADDAYLLESIIQPGAKIVQGFKDVMPRDFRGKLSDNDITALVWYIKSISANFKGDLAEGNTVGADKVLAKKGMSATKPGAPNLTSGPATSPVFNPVAVPPAPPKRPIEVPQGQ